jgi:hypothetical protein
MQNLAIKDYIPLIQTLVGGLLTFLGGLLGSVIIQQSQRKSERNSLASAFYGEIRALINIVERRQYLQLIQASIKEAKSGEKNPIFIRVTRNYFNVYERNLDKIGILPNPLPAKIVDVYTVMTAILEDFDLAKDSNIFEQDVDTLVAYLEELERLFQYALESGRLICKEIEVKNLLIV